MNAQPGVTRSSIYAELDRMKEELRGARGAYTANNHRLGLARLDMVLARIATLQALLQNATTAPAVDMDPPAAQSEGQTVTEPAGVAPARTGGRNGPDHVGNDTVSTAPGASAEAEQSGQFAEAGRSVDRPASNLFGESTGDAKRDAKLAALTDSILNLYAQGGADSKVIGRALRCGNAKPAIIIRAWRGKDRRVSIGDDLRRKRGKSPLGVIRRHGAGRSADGPPIAGIPGRSEH